MRKPASVLLMTLVLCFSAVAQTAKTRRPALPLGIYAAACQDSDVLLKNPSIKARMKRLLGDHYDSFMESFETLSPVTREGDFLFSSGCLIHACTHLESAIAIDLANKTIHAAVYRQTERTRYFNEGGRSTPKAIRDWANNLRQLTGGTNGVQSVSAFATPNTTGTQVVASPARRLRSSVPVRGFVGGESHDGYVVRAREGQTLTARLSWLHEGDNGASLAVSESPDFYTGGTVKFGTEDNNGKRWVGRVPRSGDYYLYVVAHPSAHYTIKVVVK